MKLTVSKFLKQEETVKRAKRSKTEDADNLNELHPSPPQEATVIDDDILTG